jgi:hypothetical protein
MKYIELSAADDASGPSRSIGPASMNSRLPWIASTSSGVEAPERA